MEAATGAAGQPLVRLPCGFRSCGIDAGNSSVRYRSPNSVQPSTNELQRSSTQQAKLALSAGIANFDENEAVKKGKNCLRRRTPV